ncbi:MAG: VWA domain-containing protein [Bryobacteraceae bacterium]|jgi:VWFA-related protein
MMQRVPGVAALFLFGLAGARVVAQEAGPQAPTVTFRATAQEVVLDLVVRDSRGRQVKNLKPEDVAIYEDGVLQPVKSFRMVSGREVLEQQAQEVKEGKKPAKAVTTPYSLPAVNLVCFVFHNLDPNTITFALDAVRQFLDHDLPPGAAVAFFHLGNKLTTLHGFSTNRVELSQIAAKLLDSPVPSFNRMSDAVLSATPYQVSITVDASTGTAALTITGGEIAQTAISGADVGTSLSDQVLRGLLADQRRAFGHIEGMRQWDQMRILLNELGPLPGRKTVMLLSTGLATTGDAELFQGLLDTANKGQITIYAVDVNGLTQNSNVQAGNNTMAHAAALSRQQGLRSNSAAASMENSRQSDYINMAVRTSDTQATLRSISEGTGGFLIGNTDNLGKPFEHVMEDIGTHYEATYQPTAEKLDGRLRKIEVKLARADLNVQSRTGYYALPAFPGSAELTLPQMIGLAALNAAKQPHIFDFRSAVYQFRPTAAGVEQALAFEVPASAFTARPVVGQNRHSLRVSLIALVKDSSGQVVDEFSRDVPLEVPDENLEQMRKSTIPFTHPIQLPPGRYTLETAVVDQEARRASVSRLEFESPAAKGLALSSVVLAQQVQTVNGQVDATDPFEFSSGSRATRVIPELSAALSAQAQPLAYFVVYPDKADPAKPKIEVESLADGQVIAARTLDAPAAGPNGAIPLVLRAPAHAGNCELRITAVQGSNKSVTESLAYTIGAK